MLCVGYAVYVATVLARDLQPAKQETARPTATHCAGEDKKRRDSHGEPTNRTCIGPAANRMMLYSRLPKAAIFSQPCACAAIELAQPAPLSPRFTTLICVGWLRSGFGRTAVWAAGGSDVHHPVMSSAAVCVSAAPHVPAAWPAGASWCALATCRRSEGAGELRQTGRTCAARITHQKSQHTHVHTHTPLHCPRFRWFFYKRSASAQCAALVTLIATHVCQSCVSVLGRAAGRRLSCCQLFSAGAGACAFGERARPPALRPCK